MTDDDEHPIRKVARKEREAKEKRQADEKRNKKKTADKLAAAAQCWKSNAKLLLIEIGAANRALKKEGNDYQFAFHEKPQQPGADHLSSGEITLSSQTRGQALRCGVAVRKNGEVQLQGRGNTFGTNTMIKHVHVCGNMTEATWRKHLTDWAAGLFKS